MSLGNLGWKRSQVAISNFLQFSKIFVVFQQRIVVKIISRQGCVVQNLNDLLFADDHQ